MLSFAVIFICLISTKTTSACNGFELQVNHVTNCGGSGQIVKYLNTTIALSKKCEVIATGCTEIKKFTKATYEAKVSKVRLTVYESNGDLCNIKSILVKGAFAAVGLATKCAYDKDSILCFNNDPVLKLTESAKRLLPTTLINRSPIEMMIYLTHDTGTSCFNVSYIFNQV